MHIAGYEQGISDSNATCVVLLNFTFTIETGDLLFEIRDTIDYQSCE